MEIVKPIFQQFKMLFLLGFIISISACSSGSENTGMSPQTSRGGERVESAQRAVRGAYALPTVQAKPEWFTCKQDEDCMAVEGICNSENAVNRLFRGPFVQYRNAMNRQVTCKAAPTITNAGTEVGCVKNRCVVNPHQLKQSGLPSANWPADNPNIYSY
jgi:hypothetical protein